MSIEQFLLDNNLAPGSIISVDYLMVDNQLSKEDAKKIVEKFQKYKKSEEKKRRYQLTSDHLIIELLCDVVLPNLSSLNLSNEQQAKISEVLELRKSIANI